MNLRVLLLACVMRTRTRAENQYLFNKNAVYCQSYENLIDLVLSRWKSSEDNEGEEGKENTYRW